MTARFPYYELRSLRPKMNSVIQMARGSLNRPARSQAKPHSSAEQLRMSRSKSIARNTALDPIFEKHEPVLVERLKELNGALKHVSTALRQKLAAKLIEKQKREGKKAITEADRRRWELPKTEWREWEVPFDADPDWPDALKNALSAYRAAWRAKDGRGQCLHFDKR